MRAWGQDGKADARSQIEQACNQHRTGRRHGKLGELRRWLRQATAAPSALAMTLCWLDFTGVFLPWSKNGILTLTDGPMGCADSYCQRGF